MLSLHHIIVLRKQEYTSYKNKKILKTDPSTCMSGNVLPSLKSKAVCDTLVPSALGFKPVIIGFPVIKANIKVANQRVQSNTVLDFYIFLLDLSC